LGECPSDTPYSPADVGVFWQVYSGVWWGFVFGNYERENNQWVEEELEKAGRWLLGSVLK
jgi:hypothetical protein